MAWSRAKFNTRLRYGRRGAALVEFVIVLPILMMLVFGVWEFGRIFDTWQIATNAAREGARYAVMVDDATGVAKASQYLSAAYGGRLKPSPAGDVAASVALSHPSSGEVKVVVTAHVDIWAPAVASLTGQPGNVFTLAAWSTMRQ